MYLCFYLVEILEFAYNCKDNSKFSILTRQ